MTATTLQEENASKPTEGAAWDRAMRGSSDGHWEWRPDGTTWCSPPFCEMLGYHSDGGMEIPMPFTTLLHPSDAATAMEELRACCDGHRQFDMQFRLKTSFGDFRWFRAQGAAYRNDAGRVMCVSGGIKDITDFKVTSETIRDRERRMYKRQRMDAIDCLAGGIAHEFNNLLQAVRGYISFAANALEQNCEAQEDLTKALDATDKAAGLTRRLLDFARADELDGHAIDIAETVHGLIDLVHPVLSKNIDFRSDLTDATMVCHGDETALRQALLNLCINARDAMPDGGELILRTDLFEVRSEHTGILGDLSPGPCARIMVTDNGCGIPSEDKERVFQPFYTTKEVGKGTGLGLPTVLGAVERCGGHIQLCSEVGKGTTFTIYIPIAQIDFECNAPAPQAPRVETILYVEDDEQAREVGSRMLASLGYKSICAANGDHAIEAFETHQDKIAALLLDIVIPGKTGHEVLKEIRQSSPNIPAVFATGFDPAAKQASSTEPNITVLHKPFDNVQLEQALESCLAVGAT